MSSSPSDRQEILDAIDRTLVRISKIEPHVAALVEETDRKARLARAVDELFDKFPEPDRRPALFGTLVGVKDIFHVGGLPTQAGSRLPSDDLAGPEAESVRRMRDAGALILAKTVTTEFAYFGPGPTRNPHHFEHTPGGSSSGSAAAVAAGYCPLALGTQTIGSVNRPAAFCGVYGFKPSRERISRDGVIPLSTSLDHVGLFADTLPTLRAGAEVLLREALLEEGPSTRVDRPRLAVPMGPYLERASAEGRTHFESDVDRLRAAGFEIQHVESFDNLEEIEARHATLVARDAAETHRDWFDAYADLYHPKTRELIERGSVVDTDLYEEARAGRQALRDALEAARAEAKFDLWITPSAPGTAPHGIGATGNPVMNLPWTQAGLPTLTIPSGRSAAGLPFGLQVIGRWQRDEELLASGELFTSALGDRPIPKRIE